jgi:acetyl esterase
MGQKRSYPPKIDGAEAHVYKKVGDVELKLWVFAPKANSEGPVPAMIFFFGGGWANGSPEQFVHQSRHLAQRGMAGIVADYRVASRHHVRAKSCVEDALDALQFVKSHARDLNLDPKRIGVGGGSAGGHLAACLGTLKAKDALAPDALALYNPATLLAPIPGGDKLSPELKQQLEEINEALKSRHEELETRMGVPPEQLSPVHHINASTPPTILFHGTKDTTVPFASAEMFNHKMQELGLKAVLKPYQGQAHGFFNREPYLSETTSDLDEFLVELKWLSPAPSP